MSSPESVEPAGSHRVLASGRGTSVLWAMLASGVMGLLGWLLLSGFAGESLWVLGPAAVGTCVWWLRQIRALFLFHGIEVHPTGLRIVDSEGAWWGPWKSTRVRFVPFDEIRGVTTDRERVFGNLRTSYVVTRIDLHTATTTIRIPDRLYDRDVEGLRQEILDLVEAERKRRSGAVVDATSNARRFSRPVKAARESPSSRGAWIASQALFAGIVAALVFGLGYGITWLGAPADITYVFLSIGLVPVVFVVVTSKRPIAFLELRPEGIASGRDRDRLELIPWSALASVHERKHSSRKSLSIHERPATSGLDLRTHDGRLVELRGSWTPPLDELAALLEGTKSVEITEQEPRPAESRP